MKDAADLNLPLEYLVLKAANDKLRESGKALLWDILDRICSELSRDLSEKRSLPPLQVGRQDWQFKVDTSTMVGERYGARHRTNTLVVEVGWPQLPEHGVVPDGGLARGRIGLSRNVMLEPRPVIELIFKRQGKDEPAWYTISNRKLGERVTEPLLRNFVELLLQD